LHQQNLEKNQKEEDRHLQLSIAVNFWSNPSAETKRGP
jgi:hypothetical protein